MRIPCCCCAKLAARGFTTEYRDQLASVGLPTLWAGRCLLLQVIVLGHGSLDLEILAARRALEFIDSHQSPSLRGPPRSVVRPPRSSDGTWRSGSAPIQAAAPRASGVSTSEGCRAWRMIQSTTTATSEPHSTPSTGRITNLRPYATTPPRQPS